MKQIRGLYHRWARSGPVRASGNPLIRLAARRGLAAADDLVTADAQIAALAAHVDAAFYASWYGITADPVRDYLVHGWRAGRDPRSDFDSAAYLAAHPHLARAGINPLLHALARRRGGASGEAAALPRPDTAEAHRLA
ncbi:MAG: glycosyl transferase, partial [Methylobacterium organophilum]|nr:glycosyl transferase [Methylobacterium organophilum]